jgi:hypothetical protein
MQDQNSNAQSSTLQRFFAGLSEYIFEARLGVADVQLIDYVTDLLIRFVRTDAMHRVRRMSGRPALEVVEMVVEADRRIGLARREIHQHVGDFALFWTGMYPEALRERQTASHLDQFIDYCQQGKRAYRIAAEIPAEADRPSGDLLHRLSEHFDLCAYGLRELRREFESPSDKGNEPPTILFG